MVELLLPFRSSPYWLAKVELLRTVSCLPLTALAISQPQLPHTILTHVVFSLLGDQDHRSVSGQLELKRAVGLQSSFPLFLHCLSHRVRTAAAEAMVTLAACLQMTSQPLLAHAHWEASRTFAHLLCPSQQLSLASIGDATPKSRPSTPLGLQHMLWFLLGNVRYGPGFRYWPPSVWLVPSLTPLCPQLLPPSQLAAWVSGVPPCSLPDLPPSLPAGAVGLPLLPLHTPHHCHLPPHCFSPGLDCAW